WNMAPGLGMIFVGLMTVILMKILDNPPPPEEQADITPEQEEKIALGRKIGRAFGWIIAFAGLILAMLPVIEAAKQLLDVHPAIGPLMFLIGGFPLMALVFAVAAGRR